MGSNRKKIKYDKVVIGNTPEAVEFARKNKLPILLCNEDVPFTFDEHKKEKKVKIWSKGLWELGLSGLNVLSTPAKSISVEEEKIKVTYSNTDNLEIEYNKCFLFETESGVRHNLEMVGEKDYLYRVIDWMSVDRCEKHSCENIKTKDNFINEIIFYPSDRVDGNHSFKDVVAISYIKEEDLQLFEHSDTMAVFKIRHHMLENGIKGRISYYDKKGRPHRYKVRLRPSLREKEKISKTLYQSTDKIHFCSNYTLEDIFNGKTP